MTQQRRIVVLGPVPPFRGGIAHHTGRLANALSHISHVSLFSFSRLYPRWLYPGKFQVEAQEEVQNTRIHFALDSINPFTWKKTAAHILETSPDSVLIPWWTVFLAPCFHYMARRFRRAGVQVIFFCHNVVDHESSGWKKIVSKWVLEQGDAFFVQTREEERKLHAFLGDVPVTYHPHPIYDQFPAAKGNLPRRKSLEFLFYGFIRPYKGLDVLINAMGRLRDIDFHLSIVGEPWQSEESIWRTRFREAGIEAKVEFVPRYVSDQETAEYFDRADVVVLPYRSGTGTGVVATAYHYLKPVIATRVGGFNDVVDDGITGLLVEPGDSAALAAAIKRFVENGIPDAKENIRTRVKQMTWSSMAARVLDQAENISARGSE